MKNTQKACDGCGKKRVTRKKEELELCSACQTIAEILETNPNLIGKVAEMINIPNLSTADASQELPEVLDARRFRTRDREMNTWYVSVSELEGEPIEIFASTAFDRDQHLQSRISNLTTITRLISLVLRNVFLQEKLTLAKVISQLRKSSRQKNDLPDMLARVLINYKRDDLPIPEDFETP